MGGFDSGVESVYNHRFDALGMIPPARDPAHPPESPSEVPPAMIEALKHDDIVHRMGGRFKLTALIQRRLRELVIDGARPLVERDGRSDLELVIEEIRQGMIAPSFEDTGYDPGVEYAAPETTEAESA